MAFSFKIQNERPMDALFDLSNIDIILIKIGSRGLHQMLPGQCHFHPPIKNSTIYSKPKSSTHSFSEKRIIVHNVAQTEEQHIITIRKFPWKYFCMTGIEHNTQKTISDCIVQLVL
jgi:hypothetical protein